MKKAWIENGVIRDAVSGDPFAIFSYEIAQNYSHDVPDNAEHGDTFANGVFAKYIAPELPEAATPAPKLTPVQFKLCFTPAERVAIKTARASDAMLQDAYEILDDPRLTFVDLGLQSTIGLIDYMVSKSLITADRAAQVKQGIFL